MFVHLHTHSHYSLLEGLSSPAQLAARAKELGCPALGLTDRSVMYGAVDFYKACKDQGIKPVIGCEFYVALTNRFDVSNTQENRRATLVLLSYNHAGYKNLLELSTKAFIEGFYYKPRIDWELLKEYSNGLIALSGDCWSEMSQSILRGKNDEELAALVQRFQGIYGKENFFFEIGHHPDIEDQERVNEKLITLGRELNVPLVATNDVHYAKPEDREAHEIMLCLQTGKDFDDPSRFTMRDGDYSLRSFEEMRANFPADLDSAFSNTVEIANRCSYDFVFGKNLIPSYDIPKEAKNEEDYFRILCWEGALDRYKLPFQKEDVPLLSAKKPGMQMETELTKSTPEELKIFAEACYPDEKRKLLEKLSAEERVIVDRLEYEMIVINEMGFCTYFLITQDFINWAKDHNIAVGPGRGSAAGAIVTYVLKITDLDPLKYDLLFERFLNPARVSMPDIDTDFEDLRRGEVLEYVSEKYGKMNVAQIATFGTMKAKQAVKDVGRSLGVPYQEMDAVAKKITEKLGTKLKVIVESNPEIKELLQEPKYKKVFDLALKIEGVVRQFGVHASAVLISEKPLYEYTALQFAPKDKKTLVTQFSMKPVEMLGLLKMDFLGLRNLTILRIALEIIKRTKNTDIDLGAIPLDDAASYQLFARGETNGVFQFESEGMRKWLKELKPDSFEDIIAMVSMYRPGPMAWIPVYIGKKHNLKIQFPSEEAEENFKKLEQLLNNYPEVKEILDATNMIPIYQEQILQIAQRFAGFSLGGADLLRRAIGKKIAEELLAQKEKFIEGAEAKGYSAVDAKFLFERGIEPFADYGFNKSHAACYALIAYQTAYLKTHYSTEFMTALLSTVEDNTDKLIIQIEDCISMNIEILPPDINESLVHFTAIKDGEIRFGLNAIKGFGLELGKELIRVRNEGGPFKDLVDFISRAPQGLIHRKSLEVLSLSGALNSLGVDRKVLYENTENIISFAKEAQNSASVGQTDLFGMLGNDGGNDFSLTLKESKPSTFLERLAWERKYLGFYVTGHPMQGLYKYLRGRKALIEEITLKHVGKPVEIVGMISKVKKIMTKNKDLMAYLTVENASRSVTVIVFPKSYEAASPFLEEERFVKVKGRFDMRNGECQVITQELQGISLETMIENAKKAGIYNTGERQNIGIRPLAFEEAKPEAEIQTHDVVAEQEVPFVASPTPSTHEHLEIAEETSAAIADKELFIHMDTPDVHILSDLKEKLSTFPKGESVVFLRCAGKTIKTPYAISCTQKEWDELLSSLL